MGGGGGAQGPTAVVVAPTKELVMQIATVAIGLMPARGPAGPPTDRSVVGGHYTGGITAIIL